jgi:hypothetical protein
MMLKTYGQFPRWMVMVPALLTMAVFFYFTSTRQIEITEYFPRPGPPPHHRPQTL